MGRLTIITIKRIPGASFHNYRIDYKQSTDLNWTLGPVLTYNQAQAKPLGVLPFVINTPAHWTNQVVFRIVTICAKGVIKEGNILQPATCFVIKDINAINTS